METLLNLLCPYPRGSQERDLGLMLIAIALCYLASVKIRPMPPNLDRCNACGYPRTGLDAVAVCPECGFQARTEPPPMTGLQLRPGWRVNLPLSIGLFWLDIVLIRVAMLISYLFDHFSISSALLVMHRRELLAHSYDLDLHLHLLMLINPVCMVLAGPLLARRLMIAKTLLVGILALLAFSAPVGYS